MTLWVNAPTSLFSLSQTSSDIRFGDRNPALSRADIADCWLRNEYLAGLIISQLEQVVTQWNAILFQLVYGATIYTSLFIPIYQTAPIHPMESAKKASNLQCKLWESRDLTVQPVITYIYLGEIECILFITFQTIIL
jgi:hypothetical protein